jgi:hypothetical protein
MRSAADDVGAAISFLQKNAGLSMAKNWPGPVSEYILDRIDYQTLMRLAGSQPSLALRRGSQAVFYSAIRARTNKDASAVGQLLKTAVDYGEEAALEIEYFLALHELRRRIA